MRIVNLTPHPLNFYSADVPDRATEEELGAGLLATIPPSGEMARLAVENLDQEGAVAADGATIPVFGARYGELENLPAPQEDVVYVVPLLTAMAVEGRPDLLVPHQQVRNVAGTVVGCRALGRCHVTRATS